MFLSKYGRESENAIILFLTCVVLANLQHLRDKKCNSYPNSLELFLNVFFSTCVTKADNQYRFLHRKQLYFQLLTH